MTRKSIFVLSPVAVTALLIIWTALVYGISQYGDWYIYPALVALPLVLILHIALVVMLKPRMTYIIYAIGHLCAFCLLWFGCLMLISKDSI